MLYKEIQTLSGFERQLVILEVNNSLPYRYILNSICANSFYAVCGISYRERPHGRHIL